MYGTRDKVLKDVGFHPRHPAWLAVHFNVKDGACLLSKYYDLGKVIPTCTLGIFFLQISVIVQIKFVKTEKIKAISVN